MRPVKFPESNSSLARPEGMTKEECALLPTYQGQGKMISCWKLTDEDLKILFETKQVWLHVWGGFHPPTYVGAEKPTELED